MTPEYVSDLAKQAGLFPSELGALSPRHLEMLRLAREDMREQCAKVCKEIEHTHWLRFKGSSEDRANPYVEGKSDGATECADEIRNLEV
jgi:hypothetical protein